MELYENSVLVLVKILQKISNDVDWKVVSAGYIFSLAIKNKGTLWA
jgi:hypothetical protein